MELLLELEHQLEAKAVHLHVSEEARLWLAHKGYDPQMGARPMARLIQEQIKRPLAEELLFGALEGGGDLAVGRPAAHGPVGARSAAHSAGGVAASSGAANVVALDDAK